MKVVEANRPSATRIWLLRYGPCWCHAVPTESTYFDYVRLRKTVADLGTFDENLLILSDRVIDGSAHIYRQVHEDLPAPKLVVSTGPCPYADRFWEELPNGWSPVADLLPVDIQVENCISGNPETLMAAVLRHVLARDEAESSRLTAKVEDRWLIERAATDA
ncbi:MAG TPA: hypothetical protein VMM14_04095 [Acidimicrobiia bacterium]|nr:hypothetical protein [Acidimicrobiia bacterium]